MRLIQPDESPVPNQVALGIDPGLRGAIALVSENWVHKLLDLELALNETPPSTLTGSRKNAPITQINGSYHNPTSIIDFLLPLTLIKQGGGPKRSGACSGRNERELIAQERRFFPSIIVMEDVSAQNPNSTGSSMFKLGQVKGLLTGLIHMLFPEVPIKYLRPNVWKPHLGLSSDKKQSLAMASDIWNDQTNLFTRVKDADRAEAALLGLCGLKILGQ
jgi:hypothetical protein